MTTRRLLPNAVLGFAALACASFAFAPAARAQELTAVKAGTLWLGNGKTIQNAVVLIEDGR
ncbi:MAG TPA: hypothetical protein PKE00_06760, partial [Planctomycetota bacterium]|nr:hypothetical protein [Planctomycetota bacterium]